MSILEIVIYSIITALLLMCFTFSIIDQIREKKGKKRIFFKRKQKEEE